MKRSESSVILSAGRRYSHLIYTLSLFPPLDQNAGALVTRWLLLEYFDMPSWSIEEVNANSIRAHEGKKASDAPPPTGANDTPVAKRAKTGAGQYHLLVYNNHASGQSLTPLQRH